MKKIIILLLIVINTPFVFGQKEKLGFNLQIGETYYFSLQSSSVIKQDIDGEKMTTDAAISGKTAFTVTSQKDSVYEMSVRYEKLTMTMKLQNKEITFDSDKEDSKDVFSSFLKAITGKQFLMTMSRYGKIIEVKNLDTIFDNLLEQFSKFSTQQKEQLKTQLIKAYGEKAFKGSYEMATNIYANTSVQIGDSWTISTNLESGFAAKLITKYKYTNKTENFKLITGNGTFETLPKDAYVQVNDMPTRYNLTGTMTSTLKVDNKTGWILEAKVNQSMSGNIDIKANPKLTGGLSIPMSFENIMGYSAK